MIFHSFPAGEQTADFYDDYLDSYRDRRPAPRRSNTIASWARNNANPGNFPPSRSASTRVPPSSYSGGGSIRRRGTSVSRQRSTVRRNIAYEEEEEGYGSGDYEDGSFAEFSKVRVKVRFNDEVRGLAVTPDVSFSEFMGMLSSKFDIPVDRMDVKFKDEDGGHVSMKDEMDYEMALETAKETANGKAEGKLEILCAET